MKHILLVTLIMLSNFLIAQSTFNIQYQNENVKIEENINSFHWDMMPSSSEFQNGFYGWIQFFETPSQDIQDDFKTKNLELIEYLPNKAYVFYFPRNTSIQYLKDNGVRAIVPIEGKYKLSSGLKQEYYQKKSLNGDQVLVMLSFHKHANSTNIIQELAKHKISVTQEFKNSNVLELSSPNDALETLANLPFVKSIELTLPPDEKHDNGGRGLQRSNSLDTQTPNGRNYTGKGIGVMVRDFGSIGPVPHIDFKGRLTELNSDVDPFNHGDGVAGVFAGAGNLDPTVRGAAAGATIYNVNRSQTFLDVETTNLIYNGEVQITNTSSGLNCMNEYSLNAVTVDQQIRDLHSVMHVMSAGNTNGSDCGYGAGPNWANLGGGNKTGKNMIAVGNANFDGSIVGNSSRGPAADGRIKPDIVAMGDGQFSTDENNRYFLFGGTSSASPSTAGVAAQLYEAYSDLNGGTLPPSALIKATMLNTANDAGNLGPDYTYGWGIVNGLRSVKVIEREQYLSDEIAQGNTNNHVINIPSGATQLRVMVYWSDVPGAVGVSPALVNDLDLVVKDPTNNTFLPWILDPTPDPVALNTPATNGPDHLNNMEQVQINNPTAGDYTLDISGFNVPMGPQEYYIVYEITTDNINVTYPNGGESFVPGETETIHWDAINTTEDFDLEYSIDNGSSWTSIATVPSTASNYVWNVPSSLKGAALIRVMSGSFSDMSDANFSLADQVEGFAFSQICPDGTTFTWDAVTGAESYDVYILGEKFMEVAGNSTTTSIKIPIVDPTIDIWAAIVAKNDAENWVSRRTVAINNPGGLLNCPLDNDIAISQILNDPNDFSTPCSATESIIISTLITNTGTEAQSNFEVSYQLNNETIVTEMYSGTLLPGEQVTYDFTTTMTIPGADEYTLTATSKLSGDQNQFNDAAAINFFAAFGGTALDYSESFEDNGISPPGWSINNPDNALTWIELSGVIGSDGNPTTAAYLNNWDYNAPGQEDIIVTEYFDLTETEGAVLSFDLAKAQWNAALQDGLRIEASIDCGANFIIVYEKDDLDLSTLPNYNTTDAWQPLSANDWRTELIDLTPFGGESVQLRFVNINGWSNSTFIDNIKLSEVLVRLDSEVMEAEYYNIPLSQARPLSLSATVSNNGESGVNNVSVIASVFNENDDVVYSESLGTVATLASGESATLNSPASSFTPSVAGTYSLEYIATIDGLEDIMDVNSNNSPFNVTDSIYSRDDGVYFNGFGSNDDPGIYGHLYEIVNTAEVTGINVTYAGQGVGETVQGRIMSLSNTGDPTDIIALTEVFTIEEAGSLGSEASLSVHFSTPVELEPGSYAFMIEQQGPTSLGVSISRNIFTPNTSFLSINDGGSWNTIENIFENASLAVHPVFGGRTVGIEEPDFASNIELNPNVTDGRAVLSFKLESTQDLLIEIYSMQGKRIYDQTINNVSGNIKHELDLSNQVSGMYFVKISSNGKQTSRKLNLIK